MTSISHERERSCSKQLPREILSVHLLHHLLERNIFQSLHGSLCTMPHLTPHVLSLIYLEFSVAFPFKI